MIVGRIVRAGAAALLLLAVPGAALAQASPSAYTSGKRYDAMGRVTGTISADPDGTGSLTFLAVRNTFNPAGWLIKVETGYLASWQSDAIAPANWAGFTVHSRTETGYDGAGRKLVERVFATGSSTPTSVTQYSYDSHGRPECTAVRMNTAVFASLPADACTLGTEGNQGPDRITRNIYDRVSGRLIQVRRAVGTPIEQAYVTYGLTDNGEVEFTIDANGNRAQYEYDTYRRLTRWYFPSKTRPTAFEGRTPEIALVTAGAVNTADYEEYGYDTRSNRTSLRKRDGSVIGYGYDALSRMTSKTVPDRADLAAEHENDVAYAYNLQNLQTSAQFSGTTTAAILNTYDGFGRVTGETSQFITGNPALTFGYDRNGNRTSITFPGALTWDYAYDQTNRFTQLSRSATVLAKGVYDAFGQLDRSEFYSSVPDIDWGYDTVGRLQQQRNFDGATTVVQWDFTRNPASQITGEVRSNDAYAWNGHVNVVRNYTTNGLNQYTQVGSGLYCHDANGNLTFDGARSYQYDVENRLVAMWQQATLPTVCTAVAYTGTQLARLNYDPMGRLFKITNSAGGVTLLQNDGDALVAEYNGSGTLLRRYVHGPAAGVDDPLVWYDGTGTAATDARLLLRDPRGSIVNVRNGAGSFNVINSYDEYGIPGSANVNGGRFQYTGQAWISEIGMYYYKARIYSPTLGRFLQTDPIGYEDQINLYTYVGNDSINGIDTSGLSCTISPSESGRGRVATCQIDKVAYKDADGRERIRDATDADHAAYADFETAYTDAVNNLLANSDETVEVDSISGQSSFEVNAGELAEQLGGRQFVVAPYLTGTGMATTPSLAGVDAHEGGFTIVGDGGLRGLVGEGQPDRGFNKNVQIAIAHEGLHNPGPDGVFVGGFNQRWQNRHQSRYNQAARRLLGF